MPALLASILDNERVIAVATIVALVFLIVMGIAMLFKAFYKKVDQGKALIINKLTVDPIVTFTGGLVLPIIHRVEVMDISLKTIDIDRRGKEGLICQDNIRADIRVTFYVRVNKTQEDVLKVAQAVGCERASDQRTLEELFVAKFSEALKTVGKQLDFVDLYQKRENFKDRIIEVIGKDLNGYMLEDAAIDWLEQTPVELLDKDNILDAQGIRRITELTTLQNIQTNDFRQIERKEIKRQNVEAEEAILQLERQEADARAKQQREINTVAARELAETQTVQAEERSRAERAAIKADEEIAIENENKVRQVEIAKKNRERAVLVETEKVEKDRALEQVTREREVALQTIDKDKAVEVEKKAIADVVRERVAVDKSVAEEEERIKDVRANMEAQRLKSVAVTAAEAEAQERLVKDIKAAEAAEEAAKFRAREQITLAEAEREAAEKTAQAKIRLAEATQHEAAAEGLGAARVKEADAVALEKQGRAEAAAIQARLEGEAAGLSEKAGAMKLLDETTRDHEEFRLRLEKSERIERESIHARREIAEYNALVMSEAMKASKINIVGGDGSFFDKFVGAVATGASIDGAIDQSESLQTALKPYLSGERNLPQDLKEVLSRPAVGAGDLQSVSVSAFLLNLMRNAEPDTRAKLAELVERAKDLDLDRAAGK